MPAKPKPKDVRPPPFHEALRAARKRARLKQNDLAARAGVSPRTVFRWEHGLVKPKPKMMRPIAEALRAVDAGAGAVFAAAMGVALGPAPLDPKEVAAKAAAASAATVAKRGATDSAIYLAADALDVAPQKLRATLKSVFVVLRAAGVSLEEAAGFIDDALKGAAPATKP
jgi:transcriptional regulator with XRE-family HTH domain